MIGEALQNLADIANCISGDFHLMHLNFRGAEFDTFHKKVLKKYYEEATDDFDSWSEAAAMFINDVANGNGSAERVEWTSCNGTYTKDDTITKIDELLDSYMAAAVIVFIALNQETSCNKCIGIANTLQTRIEYWSKELSYFNNRRA